MIEEISKSISKSITGREGLYKYFIKRKEKTTIIVPSKLKEFIMDYFSKKIEEMKMKLTVEKITKKKIKEIISNNYTIQQIPPNIYPKAFFYYLDKEESSKLTNSFIECICLSEALKNFIKQFQGFPFYLKIDINFITYLSPSYYENRLEVKEKKYIEDYVLDIEVEENFKKMEFLVKPNSNLSDGVIKIISNNYEMSKAIYYSILTNFIRKLKIELKEDNIRIEKVHKYIEALIKNEEYLIPNKKKKITHEDIFIMELKELMNESYYTKDNIEIEKKVYTAISKIKNYFAIQDYIAKNYDPRNQYFLSDQIIDDLFPNIGKELNRRELRKK